MWLDAGAAWREHHVAGELHQHQPVANLDLALKHNLAIIPVLNKIDLPSARIDEVSHEIRQLIDCAEADILKVSGKTGEGVDTLLEAIITKIPPPQGNADAPLQAMIFDAAYDSFRGVKSYFRIFNGTLKAREAIKFMQTHKTYKAEEIGILTQKDVPKQHLTAGNVGYLMANIKQAKEVKIGDTFTTIANPCQQAVAGFEDVRPMVFAMR